MWNKHPVTCSCLQVDADLHTAPSASPSAHWRASHYQAASKNPWRQRAARKEARADPLGDALRAALTGGGGSGGGGGRLALTDGGAVGAGASASDGGGDEEKEAMSRSLPVTAGGALRSDEVARLISSLALGLDRAQIGDALRKSAVAPGDEGVAGGSGVLGMTGSGTLGRTVYGLGDESKVGAGDTWGASSSAGSVQSGGTDGGGGDKLIFAVAPAAVALRVKAAVRLDRVAKAMGSGHQRAVADFEDEDNVEGGLGDRMHEHGGDLPNRHLGGHLDSHRGAQHRRGGGGRGGRGRGGGGRGHGGRGGGRGGGGAGDGAGGGADGRQLAALDLDGFGGAGASLPPVKVGSRSVARGHLARSGVAKLPDGGSRPTPRELKGEGRGGTNGDLESLSSALAEAEAGVAALRQAVKQDVQWVQLHCPSANMTARAQFFCKQWGAEKVSALCHGSEANRLRKALRHWKTCAELAFNAERLAL